MHLGGIESLKTIVRDSAEPLYRQIYNRYRQAIANGSLAPGARVPSVRTLASELQLSRNTVEVAYDLLIGEGYLLARGQAGTIVSPDIVPQKVKNAMAQPSAPISGATFYHAPGEQSPKPFQLGLPALDLFPHKIWSSLTAKQLRLQSQYLSYPNPAGYQPLREAISAYLHISRGLDCTSEQVFIAPGYRGVISLIGRTLLQPLDQLWLEDPCFPPARYLLAELGAQIVPVPVDQDGLIVAQGRARAPHARFALVTPAHQSPLGVTLSMERRLELLAWAEQNNAWIIEDDYDSEYRYEGRPPPALASLDEAGNVLYVGTFSKVLSPALRLSYVVVPKTLISRFNQTCGKMHDGCPLLLQGVTADFINGGYFSRHLKKMRHAYTQRRQIVISSMREVLGERLQFSAPASGLNLLARLDANEDDVKLAQQAKRQNMAVEALSARCLDTPCGKGLLLGFANIASSQQALTLATQLKHSLETSGSIVE
ncbi:PLP-dependent aminotransferase family protein [Solimicrobium silvestre]|uniref:Transcriptional regulator n=1 Tax=Solimicrobium silvestre TaxID=2099400 RepID=A0A2S9H2T1_9BURK|nr:PLP-dependent aminotransferase family protein [Solimicrobium silvestre]PRC94270.1 Transcriptional regulator [Solimicrobium silvestre]